jgi:hypothetical protein
MRTTFIDIDESLRLGSAPRRCPVLFEQWAVGVPARRISIEIFIGFDYESEIVGFHGHYYG